MTMVSDRTVNVEVYLSKVERQLGYASRNRLRNQI